VVQWLKIPVSIQGATRVLRSSGSGTGSTQPLSTTEELLGRKSSGSDLENREYSHRDPLC
jgi:hypothetical protein